MRASDRVHLFPVTVWGEDGRILGVAACANCFEALHDGGFDRVSTGFFECPRQRACWICRARKQFDGPDPWRAKDRQEGIVALHAAVVTAGAMLEQARAAEREDRKG